MVDDDDDDGFPLRSPEWTPDQPSRERLGLGSGSVLLNVMISISLIFFLPESQYIELELASEGLQGAHEVGGRAQEGGGAPHPRG